MKQVSQTFELSRFSNCLRRDLTINIRSWVLRILVMIIATAIMLCLSTNPGMYSQYPNQYNDIESMGVGTIFRFTIFLFLTVGASLFMENMVTSGQRLNSLMSPASTLEKFMSRMVIYVFGVTAVFLICFALADMLRLLVIDIFYRGTVETTYIGPFNAIGDIRHQFSFWAFLTATQATFVLGSTIAPKNAFGKTVIALVALNSIYTIVAVTVYNYTRQPGCFLPDEELRELIPNIMQIALIAWSVFCYVTSYFRLKESEIINRL